ncbi:hypothetical protein BDY17DRAFT_303049 [Neohortaea acidophila]|uniref:Secreted protein n=1 Tax=Neohortaea acidophila TaxID=245834 RepID=A0A6A6PKI2_9PEZI|nr:uncharacterized protein BDY17DRAFT_303049 [Neohortaea acidophila]KAF2480003.1 hypothetical protein BDY17DRAFT_303049 [Neohortaea acidophila]
MTFSGMLAHTIVVAWLNSFSRGVDSERLRMLRAGETCVTSMSPSSLWSSVTSFLSSSAVSSTSPPVSPSTTSSLFFSLLVAFEIRLRSF